MINRNGLIGGLALSAGLAMSVAAPVWAAKPVAIEKELLGIRVLQNYREVLLRYGAPNRVFRATETVRYQEASNLNGSPTGGIVAILDSSSSGGGGGGPMMGGGMTSPGMGGYPGARGMGGGGGAGVAAMGGAADVAGGGATSGGATGGGGGGGGSQPGDNPDASYSEAGGFTWVYLNPKQEVAYEFHFNKDGRVERIAELGRGFGQHTSRGIGLGDSIDKVYSVYGWTDRIKEEDTGKFSLLYNDRYHAQFLILKNKVIGISVFLKENQYMRFNGGSGGSGGGPANSGGAGPMRPGLGGGGSIGPPPKGGAGKMAGSAG